MLRTIFLGTVAMVGGVFWLGDHCVDRAETINLLVSSAGFVVLLAMAGLAGAGCIWLFGVCSVSVSKHYLSGMPLGHPGASGNAGDQVRKEHGLLGLQDSVWVQNRICGNRHCCPDCR